VDGLQTPRSAKANTQIQRSGTNPQLPDNADNAMRNEWESRFGMRVKMQTTTHLR